MTEARKKIILNAFHMCTPSQQWAGTWKHPKDHGTDYNTLEYYVELAQTAERGLLDGIFFADSIGLMDKYGGGPWEAIRAGGMAPMNDPTLVIPAMAMVTKNLGFGVTANLTYEHPFIMARRMSTLDHLTKGRIGWNIVAGFVDSGARAIGNEKLRAHDERYDMADEYMEVVYKLWEASWEDDAVKRDRANAVFADPRKVHRVDHAGEHFRMSAVHMCEPSMQRTPVLYQAGASTRGRAFAAKHAECVFLTSYSKEMVRNHVNDIRARTIANGRNPNDVAIIVGSTVITAPTDREAQEKHRELREYLDVRGSLSIFSALAGIDFSKYDPDDPIEYIKNDANQSFVERITILSKGKKWSVRDLTAFQAGSPTAGIFLVGSPATIAAQMIEWVEETGIDGFNLVRTAEPVGLAAIVDLVVPELQNRGAYKTAYREGSLRNKLFGHGDRLSDAHPGVRAARASVKATVE
ncbi:LLM class flavin-dependent oxidoreductase [Roseiarcaceae bacterium H3SJ34-1]|uniref:LLM class flavin-dependent oxidoreductase n=1 Tax=Terripilifer ovatus TaxID=3032367 RepID=UPI003AB94B47|nr:LLM class flavin-dependent oxidoreductase [Roseiarcaceae bacterium H3SJ34-1]